MNNKSYHIGIVFFIFTNLMLCNQSHAWQSFPIYTQNPTANQTEPIICVSPLNPDIMFVSAGIFIPSSFRSEGVYVSTNGGLNWRGNDTCTGQPINNNGGDPGVVIDKNGAFIIYHVGLGQPYFGVYTHTSTNMGVNWSNAYIIFQSNQTSPEDKGTIATDNTPSSPYYGRSYVAWVNFIPQYPVLFSYTTNSGVSWSSPAQINNPPPQRCSGGDVETGPDGQVYVAWAGVSNANFFPDTCVGFSVSTNGGVNWNVNQHIYSMNGIVGTLIQKSQILVNGLPRMSVDLSSGPRRGWIYLVTNEINKLPAGSDPDIIFHRSTDGGQTWSTSIRVNQDPLNNGKIQYFPAICVDSTGAINVLYYDDRNTTSDSTEVYMSRSTDGGSTWSEFLVSDKRFKPYPVYGYYQGDFISIVSARNKLFPIWMANYNTGIYKVWMTIIDINAIGIKQISTNVPEKFILKQNYPNPFNPSTTIEFSVPKRENVKIIIYDALGKEVQVLINTELNPGTYKTDLEAGNLSSGIYFYSLQTEGFRKTKKMVLVK